MLMIPHRTLCIAFAVSLMTLGHRAHAEKPLDYNRDVRPILSENCFYCHGPDPEHRKADLRFDDEEAAKDYAIVPGDLESSEFFQRLIAEPDSRMPPVDSGKKLSAKDIDTLKR